ncbi:MAG: PAS domain-containing protein, partial [Kiritimatiellaeota bacterium]|nr:PAS domain-containing protein [Kiritimatiellota bacterium]
EHAALQNAANGNAITDQTGHIIYVNPAMTQMWDYRSSDKMCGRAITELFAEPAIAGQTISANLSTNETWIGELRARRRTGEEFNVQISAALNRNANDELVGLVFSFLDVSDRHRAASA